MGKFERNIKRKKLKKFKKYLKEEQKRVLFEAQAAYNLKKYLIYMIDKYYTDGFSDKENQEFEEFINSKIFDLIPLNSLLNNQEKQKLLNLLKKYNKQIDLTFICENCKKEYKRFSSYQKHKEKCQGETK